MQAPPTVSNIQPPNKQQRTPLKPDVVIETSVTTLESTPNSTTEVELVSPSCKPNKDVYVEKEYEPTTTTPSKAPNLQPTTATKSKKPKAPKTKPVATKKTSEVIDIDLPEPENTQDHIENCTKIYDQMKQRIADPQRCEATRYPLDVGDKIIWIPQATENVISHYKDEEYERPNSEHWNNPYGCVMGIVTGVQDSHIYAYQQRITISELDAQCVSDISSSVHSFLYEDDHELNGASYTLPYMEIFDSDVPVCVITGMALAQSLEQKPNKHPYFHMYYGCTDDPTQVQIHEGRVWDTRPFQDTFPNSLFNKYKVIWYDTLMSGEYAISIGQCERYVSPWEVTLDSEENYAFKNSYTNQDATVREKIVALLTSIKDMEGFKSLLNKPTSTECMGYNQRFPNAIDLKTVAKRCGTYKTFNEFIDDIETVVQQAKEWNSPDRIQYIAAEMIEKRIAQALDHYAQ
ncbi:hypothetical protein PCE1_000870 [Barthelona sp. PCE]